MHVCRIFPDYIMWFLNYILVILLVDFSQTKLTRINSKNGNTVFKYREEANSERKLKECAHHEACNVVHKRFWLPNIVERICRCPNGFECPWSQKSNSYSMMLNNRSVLKFCEPVNKTETCTRKQSAAIVHGKVNEHLSSMVPHNIQVNCNCPKTHHWKLKKYIFGNDDSLYQIFRCQKQTMCDSKDFCGYIRADIFSVYYHCSCPEGHLCISKDREKENVQELLYTGPAYNAYCLRWK